MPSPPPPRPPNSPGALTVTKALIRTTLTANGDPSDFNEEKKLQIRDTFARLADVAPSHVNVTVMPASVQIQVDIVLVDDATKASLVQAALATNLSSAADANRLFGDLGLVVVQTPMVTKTTDRIVVAPPPPFNGFDLSSQHNSSAFVMLYGVGAAMLILVAFGIWQRRWRERQTSGADKDSLHERHVGDDRALTYQCHGNVNEAGRARGGRLETTRFGPPSPCSRAPSSRLLSLRSKGSLVSIDKADAATSVCLGAPERPDVTMASRI